jgi:hypothetical protein
LVDLVQICIVGVDWLSLFVCFAAVRLCFDVTGGSGLWSFDDPGFGSSLELAEFHFYSSWVVSYYYVC